MKHFIETHFGFCLGISAVLAFFQPNLFLPFEAITAILLMISLFLGFLKIQFSEILHLKDNFLKLIFLVVLSLFLLPTFFYFLSFSLNESMRMGLFLIISISGAVMSPLLASFMKLKILWTTAFVVLTSFLLPISLPFLLKTLFHVSIEISFLEMFLFLGKMVLIPALFAVIFNSFFSKATGQIKKFSSLLGVLNMSFFIALLIAQNQEFLSENLFTKRAFLAITLLFMIFFIKFLIGFLFPAEKQEKWTNSLMFGNVNTGIAILFASQFFGPEILFITLLSEIPWVSAQVLFPFLKNKFY